MEGSVPRLELSKNLEEGGEDKEEKRGGEEGNLGGHNLS